MTDREKVEEFLQQSESAATTRLTVSPQWGDADFTLIVMVRAMLDLADALHGTGYPLLNPTSEIERRLAEVLR